MKSVALLSIGLLAMLLGEPAEAADLTGFQVEAPPAGSLWSWSGFYLGGHIGVARGTSHVTAPFGPSIFGDIVATPGFIGGAQAGYNWQFGTWVLGVEGDLGLADMRGTSTCFAFSGTFVSSNCVAKTDWFSTVTGRIGQALGPDGRTLVYGKGGVAFAHNHLDVSVNNQFIGGGIAPPSAIQSSATQTGWTVGVGVEQALTPAWSVKVEYDYLNFGKFSIVDPPSATVVQAGPNTGHVGILTPPTAAGADQNVHVMKLGLNYKWGADPFATWGPASGGMPMKAAPMVANGWSFEVGGRYWYSSGEFQKDLPAATTSSTSLVSRVTSDGVTGNSGEIFGRIDSPWGPFVKGFVGAGRTNSGQMNDEDCGSWPAQHIRAHLLLQHPVRPDQQQHALCDLRCRSQLPARSRLQDRRFRRLQLLLRADAGERLHADRLANLRHLLAGDRRHAGHHRNRQVEFAARRRQCRGDAAQFPQGLRGRRLSALRQVQRYRQSLAA